MPTMLNYKALCCTNEDVSLAERGRKVLHMIAVLFKYFLRAMNDLGDQVKQDSSLCDL